MKKQEMEKLISEHNINNEIYLKVMIQSFDEDYNKIKQWNDFRFNDCKRYSNAIHTLAIANQIINKDFSEKCNMIHNELFEKLMNHPCMKGGA